MSGVGGQSHSSLTGPVSPRDRFASVSVDNEAVELCGRQRGGVMRLPVHLRTPSTAVLARWGRIPGLRTAKATFAAVLAYGAADLLNTSDAPILAALTALLVVQLTVYETVAQGVQRILSVLAGVLVALAIAAVVGLTWWSLGAVVAVALVVGVFLRLGPHALEVPISAMLVLAVGGGGAEGAAAGRVYETLIGAAVGGALVVGVFLRRGPHPLGVPSSGMVVRGGGGAGAGGAAGGGVYEPLPGAAVGVVVNFAVPPPVHVRPAGAAIGHVADRLA